MSKIRTTTKRLLLAFESAGYLFVIDRVKLYSAKLHKVVRKSTLQYLMPTATWNESHRDKKPKDPAKITFVKVPCIETFSELAVLLKLVEYWKLYNRRGGRLEAGDFGNV